MGKIIQRPNIIFIPASSDLNKIHFFGTLMPTLLLLFQAPGQLLIHLWNLFTTPHANIEAFIQSQCDDVSRLDNIIVFIHRWHKPSFDPVAFAGANSFLTRLARLIRKAGYNVQVIDPLSPLLNLPKLAAQIGAWNLSPFGLLVHPRFGPRVIISAISTDYPLQISARWKGGGCTDCMACLQACPQSPLNGNPVDLGKCQSCAKCILVCPTGQTSF